MKWHPEILIMFLLAVMFFLMGSHIARKQSDYVITHTKLILDNAIEEHHNSLISFMESGEWEITIED